MCEVHEVVVTEPIAYFAHFVKAKYAFSFDSIETYVDNATHADRKAKEILNEAFRRMGVHDVDDVNVVAYLKAYVYAFCKLKKLRNALILVDWMTEEPYENHFNIAAFNLPEDRLREVVNEIKDYQRTIEKAMEHARDADRELLERCHYLDVGTDVKRCLVKAREVLSKAKPVFDP